MMGVAQQILDGCSRELALELAIELENEIERRGLWHEYIPALIDIINTKVLGYSLTKRSGEWALDRIEGDARGIAALIRATPEQKARAFLKVIQK